MTSKYEDNHVVEDHMGDLLILIGHFRDELCWKDSITVYSQLFCHFMCTMACYLTLYVISSLMVLQGK